MQLRKMSRLSEIDREIEQAVKTFRETLTAKIIEAVRESIRGN